MFNYGYIKTNGLFPGAIVQIAKMGDIIPQIIGIIKPNFDGDIPDRCPCGKGTVYQDGIHIYCAQDPCTVKALKKFIVGLGVFRMRDFGGVTRRTLYESGYDEIWKIFEKSLFTEAKLVATGNFKYGRTLTKLLDQVNNLQSVTLPQIILSLGFDGIGSTAARELSKYIRGKKYSFTNLERAPLNGFDPGQPKRIKVEHLVEIFKRNNIEVIEEIVVLNGIGCEFTGSPKESGLNTKAELEKELSKYGYIHAGLKTAKFLLTDSISSSSSKMAEARKRGVKIYEYSDFINKLRNGEQV